ncbi:MAG: hypothetical protein O3B73_00110 [bacterium]|nr:hypothetical protein [bacterium]
MTHSPSRRHRLLERIIIRLENRLSTLDVWHRRLSWTRLGIVGGGFLVAVLANFVLGNLAAWMAVALAILGFLVTAKNHNRIEQSVLRFRVAHQIKKTHLARLRLDWDHISSPPAHASDPNHPFENDINLTGSQSLLHLIDTTQSEGGRKRLTEWILRPDLDLAPIQNRQTLVSDLMALGSFRDRLTQNARHAQISMDRRWDGEHIVQWLNQHAPRTSLLPYVVLLGTLALITLASGILSALDFAPPLWHTTWPLYLVLYFGLYALKARELGALLRESSHLERTLAPFAGVLSLIERQAFARQPHIKHLCEPIQNSSVRPSRDLRKLMRIAGAGRWQQGQILWVLLNACVPWDLVFTYLLNRCKADVRDHLPNWLKIWYDLEALSALAHFGATHTPGHFPILTAEARFEGRGLDHPLIPEGDRVPNDFTFSCLGEVVIITGSNMSGKSTFLRTLGINLCLAYAGAPVLASSLKTGLFRLYTCIKVSDSVIDGISYFYAEVRRLKALLAELKKDHPLPVFFLIDEIFRGTNNRERYIGSRSYIRALTQHQGIGMVTTHDLELTHLENEFPSICNWHFRETIENNKMAFDYTLHPGPCPTTNALTIMRLEGLPLEDTDS